MNLTGIMKLRKHFQKHHWQCKEWCFECCTAIWLTVDERKLMKKELLRKWLTNPPKWKWDDHCEYLTTEWKCSVYNQRPIICRSFSDQKLLIRVWDRKILTQSCTYWSWEIVEAPQSFVDYSSDLMKKWILNEYWEKLMKEVEQEKKTKENITNKQ